MALARLRRVLQSSYSVRVESSQKLVNRVTNRIAKRAQEFIAKNAPPPVTKTPIVVAAIQGQQDWIIRAIDLLHKIGELTTPIGVIGVNMARLSASWATRRYFWAVAEGDVSDRNFRLSNDARLLDFHQKTLLSDEFGVGMAGLLMEEYFNAGSFVDVSAALNDPAVYQDIDQVEETQPDYLMWGETEGSPYYVVECKGTQSDSSTSMGQLRRGMEQVPSLVFGAGARPITTLVVATCMEADRTTVYVLDPPPDEPDHDRKPDDRERVSERIGKRSWKIASAEAFQNRIWLVKESELLKWAGQFHSALARDKRLEVIEEVPQLPNLELQTRRTEVGTFRGTAWPVFPELGKKDLKVFSGVEEELLTKIIESDATAPHAAEAIHERIVAASGYQQQRSPFVSVSRNGTCMIIEGVD